MNDRSEMADQGLTQAVFDMPPYRQETFLRWLMVLGQKDKEAQRIARLFEKRLSHVGTWAEITKLYGKDD